jgi:hypothetical protein
MIRLHLVSSLLLTAVPGMAQMTERTLPLFDGRPEGLTTVPDFDGDGRPDFAIGSANVSPGGTLQVGRVRFQSSATGASAGEITAWRSRESSRSPRRLRGWKQRSSPRKPRRFS